MSSEHKHYDINPDGQKFASMLETAQNGKVVKIETILDTYPEISASDADDLYSALEEAGYSVQGFKQSKRKKTARFEPVVSDEKDLVGLYLSEVKEPLLTKEEEIELFKKIEKGKEASIKIKDAKNGNLEALEHEINTAEEARNRVAKANLRLVVSIAKKYLGRGLPFPDLIQEGNLGLLKAIDKFEYQRGHRFSTYAVWWIRQSVSRGVTDFGRTIRIPVHSFDRMNKMFKVAHKLRQELHREPTDEELAQEMQLPVKKIQFLRKKAKTTISFELPVGDEEDSTLEDFIEDTSSVSPQEKAYQTDLQKRTWEVLETLTPREALVLSYRFGLTSGEECTLEEIGQKLGVTRERIRQIETKALNRLRHKKHAHLKDFIKD